MSEWLSRAGDLFVAPAAERPARRAAAAAGGTASAVVLGAAGEAGPVARLLSGALRGRARAACALTAEWRAAPGAEPLGGGPSGREARLVAARLEGRGLRAAAQGRTVRLALPADPGEALAAWGRAVAAAGCPAVLAIEAGRPAALEAALLDADLVVVVLAPGAEAVLGPLALAGLAHLRGPVATARPLPAGAARLLSASSLATARTLGAEVLDAVRAIP